MSEGYCPKGVAFSRTLRAREDAKALVDKNPTPENEDAYLDACIAHHHAKQAYHRPHWQD